MDRWREPAGWALLVGELVGTVCIVPDWSPRHFGEPAWAAACGGVATTLLILGLRLAGRRGSRIERTALAIFLAGMPLVYLASWFRSPQPGWLACELVGVLVFGGLAVLGVKRSPWFLAGGIAAHGLAWDAWHVDHASFVPRWYAIGCALVDVCLGLYVALEAPRFREGATRSPGRIALRASRE